MRRLTGEKIKCALDYVDCFTTEEKGEQVRQICSRSAALIDEKGKRRRIGFLAFLRRQIRFLGWKIWMAQSFLMLFFYKMLDVLYSRLGVRESRVALLLCSVSVLTLFLAMPSLYQSMRCGMYEMECATRFSSWKVLAVRLILISAGNMLLFGGFWVIAALKTPLQAGSILLYLLLPYLAVKSGMLYLLVHLPVRRFAQGSNGLGIACLCLLFLLYHFYPALFQQTFSAGKGLLCAILLLSVIVQMHSVINGSPCVDA